MTDEDIIEDIDKKAEILNSLIEKLIEDEDRKNALLEMFDKIGTHFLMSPASSRDSYHNSYYGGLFDHSLNVWQNLCKANEAFELGFTEQEMFTAALLHDIGKAVAPNLEDPHYADSEPWRKKKLGQGFEPDYTSGYFTNRDRTMFVLQRFNIKLSAQEYQAILLNDGPIVDGNRSYSLKEYTLSTWLHFADYWAAVCENNEAKKSKDS